MKLIRNVMLALLMCLPLLSTGCYMDDVEVSPGVVYYNGGYGYYYGNMWYPAPYGYVYGRPINWGPYHYRGYGARSYYRSGSSYRGGYGGGYRGGFSGGRGGFHGGGGHR